MLTQFDVDTVCDEYNAVCIYSDQARPIDSSLCTPIQHQLNCVRFIKFLLLLNASVSFTWVRSILSHFRETPLSELSIELLLLQVVMPALLEQSQTRASLKVAIRFWCLAVGRLLGLNDYLLPHSPVGAPATNDGAGAAQPPQLGIDGDLAAGAEPLLDEQQQNANNLQPPIVAPVGINNNLGAEHQALMLIREPMGFQSYEKPSWFTVRILLLLFAMAASTVLASFVALTFPGWH